VLEEHRVSIVIPAYHEEQVIGRILDELRTTAEYHEILVVDDGSTDDTAKVAEEHGARVIRHPYNIGNGAAVKTGIRNATGNIIVLMDADGQHPPQDVSRLLAHIDEYDMVVGTRSRSSDSQRHRNLANQLFNYYASYITGHPIPDLTSGFRVIRAPLAKRFAYLLPNGFSYPTTLTITLFRAGFRVRYEPFVSPRRTGKSKIKPLRDALRFLLTMTRLAVLFVPLKIFLPVSVAFLLMGVGYTAYQILTLHRFSNMPPLLLMVGIMIFLNGLIAEQIALQGLSRTEIDE
jgi:glycosyltransferase involved in cell wall biosynthesis